MSSKITDSRIISYNISIIIITFISSNNTPIFCKYSLIRYVYTTSIFTRRIL